MKITHIPDPLTQISLAEIARFQRQPCLSLYQPTHRCHPDNQQDRIRFRHLVKALDTSLRQEHTADTVQALVQPFEALAQDQDFWNHTLDGLAVLGAPGLFRVFLLQSPVAELAVVADSFHTKPLRQWLQSVERYQVLALSLNKVQLFEGDRNALDAVLEHHSRPSGLPLMLAALPEHHHRFREVSHNPFLMASGLMVDPEERERNNFPILKDTSVYFCKRETQRECLARRMLWLITRRLNVE